MSRTGKDGGTHGPARRQRYRRGVGAIVVNAEGRVLVAQRIDAPGEAWQLPQGGIRKGEKARAALRRELAEEIGTDRFKIIAESARRHRYDLPKALADRVWKGRYRGQKQRWFVLRFTGTDTDIDLAVSDQPEFTAWRWVRIEELPDLAVDFKRRLYEELVAEFSELVSGGR